jgi:hypothetical protein
MPHKIACLLVFTACVLVAACGGGGGSHTTPSTTVGQANGRKPDATFVVTIKPTQVRHGLNLRRRVGQSTSKKRSPAFIDPQPDGSYVYLQFYPYNAPASFGTISVPTGSPVASGSVQVFSGQGTAYGQEYYNDSDMPLASNNWVGTYYNIDPGTSEALSMTLSLEPATIFVTQDPTLQSAYTADPNLGGNFSCLNVGGGGAQGETTSSQFALIPGDVAGDYAITAPIPAGSTPPNFNTNPQGLNGMVYLAGTPPFTATDGNGNTSTITATGATWNGYPVYNFVYTAAPGGSGSYYAPAYSGQAITFDPDNGNIDYFNVIINGCYVD